MHWKDETPDPTTPLEPAASVGGTADADFDLPTSSPLDRRWLVRCLVVPSGTEAHAANPPAKIPSPMAYRRGVLARSRKNGPIRVKSDTAIQFTTPTPMTDGQDEHDNWTHLACPALSVLRPPPLGCPVTEFWRRIGP